MIVEGVRVALCLSVLGLLLGCSSVPPARESSGTTGQATPAAATQPKSLTIAIIGDINTLGGPSPSNFVAIPTRMIHPFMNEYMTGHNQDDVNQPRVAAALPSVDDGTWQVSS